MIPRGSQPQPPWTVHVRRWLRTHPRVEAWLRRKTVGVRGLWFEDERP